MNPTRPTVAVLVITGLMSLAAQAAASSCPRIDDGGFVHCNCDGAGIDEFPLVTDAEIDRNVQVHLNWAQGVLLELNQRRLAALSRLSDWAQLAPLGDTQADWSEYTRVTWGEMLDQLPAPGIDMVASAAWALLDESERVQLARAATTLQEFITDQNAYFTDQLAALTWERQRAELSCQAADAADEEVFWSELSERRRLTEREMSKVRASDLDLRYLGRYVRKQGAFSIYFLEGELRQASLDVGARDLDSALNRSLEGLKKRLGASSLAAVVERELRLPIVICSYPKRHTFFSNEEKYERFCTRRNEEGKVVHNATDAVAGVKAATWDAWKGDIAATRIW